jgi:hypothetical protein
VLGTQNFNGYTTTAFSNDLATQYQGGGLGSSHIIQTQGYAAENLVDGTLTLTSANITAVASSVRAALTTPAVTGTKGQISFGAITCAIGQAIRVTGTLAGTATGIVSGQNYWIIATNGTTTATLAATANGNPITTTAGTLTGLTLTRCFVTFTLAGQTSFPFGRNALVTVANVTNVTDGTYPVGGATSSLTSISLGIPHTVAPTLPGTQQFTIPTVTNGGGGFRIRAYPLATPLNPQNRLNIIDHTAASCTLRANTFTLSTGAYANTGTNLLTIDSSGNTVITGDVRVNGGDIQNPGGTSAIILTSANATTTIKGDAITLEDNAGTDYAVLNSTSATFSQPVGLPVYTVATKPATGAVGRIIAISDSPTSGGRIAFYDTTNSRWSYISDNSAV